LAHVNGATHVLGAAGVAGSGFSRPAGMAADGQGNFFVADSLDNLVREFDRNGNQVAVAGGPGSGVQFHEPWGVAVDQAGNVYIGFIDYIDTLSKRYNVYIERSLDGGTIAAFHGPVPNVGRVYSCVGRGAVSGVTVFTTAA